MTPDGCAAFGERRTTAIDPGPVIPEREFLGLDTVVEKALERTRAAETAADELVRLYHALRTWLPSTVTGDTARAATAWEEHQR